MPRYRLYGFHICIQGSKEGQIRIPKYMRRRSIQVDGFADAFHRAIIAALRDGGVASADNITAFARGLKVRQQVFRDGYIAEARS